MSRADPVVARECLQSEDCSRLLTMHCPLLRLGDQPSRHLRMILNSSNDIHNRGAGDRVLGPGVVVGGKLQHISTMVTVVGFGKIWRASHRPV